MKTFLSFLQIKLVGPDSQPVANELLYLFVEDSKKMMLTTDAKGIAQFSLDTSEWKSSVSLKVSALFVVCYCL